ncbi:MAG: putative alginate lyase, partial [Rhodocyclales bacterium]|nr:putative alginate lyase [Rhodocyclales bacterium]
MKKQIGSNKMLASVLAVAALTSSAAFAATPANVLSFAHWTLQLPIGSSGSPTTISSASLVGGFTDAYFLYDNSDGTPAVAFFAPDNGVTTANSLHPRSELREMQSNGTTAANWDPFDAKTHTLSTTVKVTDARHRLVVGQIHIGTVLRGSHAASTKPLMELYYETNGALTVGVNGSPTASQTETGIGTVAVGTKFSYQIVVSAKTLKVYINGVSKYSKAIPTGFTD